MRQIREWRRLVPEADKILADVRECLDAMLLEECEPEERRRTLDALRIVRTELQR